MDRSFLSRVWRTRALLVAVLALAALSACTPQDEKQLLRAVPALDAETARHLLRDSDAEFLAYAQQTPRRQFDNIKSNLANCPRTLERDEYFAAHEVVQRVLQRVGVAMDSLWGAQFALQEWELRERLGAEQAWEYDAWLARMHRENCNLDAPASARADICRVVLQRATELNDKGIMAVWEGNLADALAADGDSEGWLEHTQRGLAFAREYGNAVMQAQYLGEIGSHYGGQGRRDSLDHYWDQSLLVSEEHQLPQMQARIFGFCARREARRGRFSRAKEFYARAQDLARAHPDTYLGVRATIEEMQFHADLGSWETVRWLRERARLFLDSSTVSAGGENLWNPDHWESWLEQLEGRRLLAAGHPRKAQEAFTRSYRRALADQSAPLASWATLLRARSLRLCSDYDAAESDLRKGLADARTRNFTSLQARFHLEFSHLHFARGDAMSARASIDEFDRASGTTSDALRKEMAERDLLAMRIHRERSDAARETAAMHRGLTNMHAVLEAGESSSHAYLSLQDYDDFHRLAMRRLESDPARAYDFMMRWRELPVTFADPSGCEFSSLATDPLSLLDEWTTRGGRDRASELIGVRNGVQHLHFSIADTLVVRHLAGPRGVRTDTLATNHPTLKQEVAEVLRELSSDPGDPAAPIPAPLTDALRRLARILLPQDVLDSSPVPLYVSADDFLRMFPFAVLNISETGYRPFLELRAVASLPYLRATDLPPSSRPPVIVCPEYSRAVQRANPGITPLAANRVEWDHFRSLYPNALILRNEAASRDRVLSAAQHAPVVYFSSHIMRDPEVSYLAFLPLTAEERSLSSVEDRLEIADIRGADFSQCELVVLAACASSAASVEGSRAAPSLGQAFLDAGAESVVEAHWKVVDEHAAELMVAFLTGIDAASGDPVAALWEAQQAWRERYGSSAHPFFWGSFGIAVTSLDARVPLPRP